MNDMKFIETNRTGIYRKMNNGSLISLFTSGIALLVSIVSVFSNLYYSNKEYEYKLDPEVEVTGGFGMHLVQDMNQQEIEPFYRKFEYRDIREK